MRILSERLALPRSPSLTWYKAGSGNGLDLTCRLSFYLRDDLGVSCQS